MVNTYQEIWEAIQSDMNVVDEAPLFPLATVKNVVNRAYVKIGGLFRWPGTDDAKKTSTQKNLEYYDYPQSWRPNSIWRLEVDGDQYGESPDGSPMTFEDYLIWRADSSNATSTEKKWANQKMRYFIYPVPTSAGTNNITVWGQKTVDELTDSGDITIFSYSMPELNEAIVLEADAILKNKGEEEKSGELRSAGAKEIAIIAWNKIRQEKAKYEKTQPFFYVEDMFSGKSKIKQDIGNF